MKVWIDADLCTGAGTCEQIAPDIFAARQDGVWAVKEDAAWFGATTIFDGSSAPGHGPDGALGIARVPDELIDDVVDAAEMCPAECIYLEA